MKFLSVVVLMGILLTGCQDTKNGTLDTSKLNKIEMEDLTEQQQEKIPISYEASSLKAGLVALPFEIKLPKKLPFESTPFQPPTFMDFKHDGKVFMVEFKSFSKNKDEKILLIISVSNIESNIDTSNTEPIELKGDIVAIYSGKALSFSKDKISYSILYMNNNISNKQHKKDIIEIANQMIIE
ncbi:hypothetical protein KDN24_17895 [Bacillus sp. Bva_UNVM-123]|uniref:hypothetical protein n=1 Tax=Bacillus sp. Bva_UNVM-123 TaxID=2829798 RepID=UPI00391F9583